MMLGLLWYLLSTKASLCFLKKFLQYDTAIFSGMDSIHPQYCHWAQFILLLTTGDDGGIGNGM